MKGLWPRGLLLVLILLNAWLGFAPQGRNICHDRMVLSGEHLLSSRNAVTDLDDDDGHHDLFHVEVMVGLECVRCPVNDFHSAIPILHRVALLTMLCCNLN